MHPNWDDLSLDDQMRVLPSALSDKMEDQIKREKVDDKKAKEKRETAEKMREAVAKAMDEEK